jgi:hypothetical protein
MRRPDQVGDLLVLHLLAALVEQVALKEQAVLAASDPLTNKI